MLILFCMKTGWPILLLEGYHPTHLPGRFQRFWLAGSVVFYQSWKRDWAPVLKLLFCVAYNSLRATVLCSLFDTFLFFIWLYLFSHTIYLSIAHKIWSSHLFFLSIYFKYLWCYFFQICFLAQSPQFIQAFRACRTTLLVSKKFSTQLCSLSPQSSMRSSQNLWQRQEGRCISISWRGWTGCGSPGHREQTPSWLMKWAWARPSRLLFSSTHYIKRSVMVRLQKCILNDM